MVRALLRMAHRRLGAERYLRAAIVGQFLLTPVAVAAGIWGLDLYVGLDGRQFRDILAVAEALTAVEVAASSVVALRLARPALEWARGDGAPAATIAAWKALAGLPLAFLRWGRGATVVIVIVPISAFNASRLDAPFVGAFLAIAAGTAIVLAYNAFVRFFLLEQLVRPVLADVARSVPDGSDLGDVSAPLRTRLLVALPATNVITAVTVLGLANHKPGIHALGVGVLVTLGVAATVSLELSVLLTRSVLDPLDELREGTARVTRGDLTARVPVLGSDETGALAGSFNQMVAGLQEREQLREAFGAFVDPGLAERVLREGTILEGDEVDVTVLFLDIRDFTAFAERATAREVVERLNDFYERIVPVLVRHGGHANKFVGDGLLGVFGAPDRVDDHADRAVAAALEIAAGVQREYEGSLRIGIGVNSGAVVAGTIGGGGHVEFTVIGDAVNTASRVEAATRDTGDVVLVTGATLALLRRDHGGFVDRPSVALKGKREQVTLHAPCAIAGAAQVGSRE
jgi:class 3 adenylate cyclase